MAGAAELRLGVDEEGVLVVFWTRGGDEDVQHATVKPVEVVACSTASR